MATHGPPLFTVIIPNYNMGKWVRSSVQSVLDQSFTDFELIVIDNCSTDNSREEIQSFKDERMRIYNQICNVGMYANLNVALMLSNGKYIKIHCSDDILHPQCLEILASTLQKAVPSERPIYLGFEMLVGKPGETHPTSWLEADLTSGIEPYKSDIHTGIATGLPNVCVDSAAFKKFGGFGTPDPQRDFSRDMLRLGLFSENCDCLTLALPLSFERSHPGQSRYSLSKRWQLNEMYTLRDSTGGLATPEGRKAMKTLAGLHLVSALKSLASGKGFGYLTHTLAFSIKNRLVGLTYSKAAIFRILGIG